jgi:hypothetical protein
VTATPNSSHSFVDWTQNGKVVSTSASYTFTMSSASATLTATSSNILAGRQILAVSMAPRIAVNVARLPQTARQGRLRTCQPSEARNFRSAWPALCSVAWRSSNTLSYINRHYGQW